MQRIITVILALAIMLSACTTSQGAAPVDGGVYNLMDLCGDEKCDPRLILGDESLNLHVIRDIGGGASGPQLAVYEKFAAKGIKIDETYLVTHIAGGCQNCGGLKAADLFLDGATITPPELGSYVANYLKDPDIYYSGLKSAQMYMDYGSKAGTAFWLDTTTGELIPYLRWEDGFLTHAVSAVEYDSYLVRGGAIPRLSSEVLSEGAKNILARNAAAMPNYKQLAQTVYGGGFTQPFTRVILTTQTSWESTGIAGRGFVVTALDEGLIDATDQLSYAWKHAPRGGATPMNFVIQVDATELPAITNALNESVSYRALLADANWGGSVLIGNKAVPWTAIRYPNQPLSQLYLPAMENKSVRITVPAVVNEVTVAETMASLGRPVEQSMARAIASNLLGYAGKTVVITLVVGDWLFYGQVAFWIVDELGQTLFRYGPELPISASPMGSYDPTGGNQALYQQVWYNTMVNMPATSVYSADMTGIWLHIQEQAMKGEQPCVFLVNQADAVTKLPIACAMAPFIQNDPRGISFFWPDGQRMDVMWEGTNWSTASSGDVEIPLETLDSTFQCLQGYFIEGAPLALTVRTACQPTP